LSRTFFEPLGFHTGGGSGEVETDWGRSNGIVGFNGLSSGDAGAVESEKGVGADGGGR